MVSQKVPKAVTPAPHQVRDKLRRESPAAAGLIPLDSRVRGNDNNRCFLTFYETITFIAKKVNAEM